MPVIGLQRTFATLSAISGSELRLTPHTESGTGRVARGETIVHILDSAASTGSDNVSSFKNVTTGSMEESMTRQILRFGVALLFACAPINVFAADPLGLITVLSNYSVTETIQRFEDAMKAAGWMIFARLDHAAAAEKYQQKLLPRTVIVFGNPGSGTANMVKAPTLAIDLPPKALVWQDDQGKVWLSYNSAQYLLDTIYARHGVAAQPSYRVEALAEFLKEVAEKATQ